MSISKLMKNVKTTKKYTKRKNMKKLLLTALLLLTVGCSSWSYKRRVEYVDGRVETITAGQSQCMVFSDRANIEVILTDGSSVTVGKSTIDPEAAVRMAKALEPAILGIIQAALMIP